jgi:fluoroacetyl-CoA thioesterase
MTDPEIGATATAEIEVGEGDLASVVSRDPTDTFPAVFATARMVALMEIASGRVLRPLLGPGEQSVGVSLDIVHTAPTPPGARVTATSRYVGREGKLHVFEVAAHDSGGEVGRGRHKRAVVAVDRLVAGAKRRVGAPLSGGRRVGAPLSGGRFPRWTREQWAKLGIAAQFLAILRLLGEYFRLKQIHGGQLTLALVEPFVTGALLSAILCSVAVTLFFFRRYTGAIVVSLVTVAVLLLYKTVAIGWP